MVNGRDEEVEVESKSSRKKGRIVVWALQNDRKRRTQPPFFSPPPVFFSVFFVLLKVVSCWFSLALGFGLPRSLRCLGSKY